MLRGKPAVTPTDRLPREQPAVPANTTARVTVDAAQSSIDFGTHIGIWSEQEVTRVEMHPGKPGDYGDWHPVLRDIPGSHRCNCGLPTNVNSKPKLVVRTAVSISVDLASGEMKFLSGTLIVDRQLNNYRSLSA